MRNVLDTKELLGYRLLADEDMSSAVVTSVKMSTKPTVMEGRKPRPRNG